MINSTNDPKMALALMIPKLGAIQERVAGLDTVMQFKNSLKFVNASTGMALDRMMTALDALGAECYLEGCKEGLKLATEVVLKEGAQETPLAAQHYAAEAQKSKDALVEKKL